MVVSAKKCLSVTLLFTATFVIALTYFRFTIVDVLKPTSLRPATLSNATAKFRAREDGGGKPAKVIILARQRTGSTYTASFFKNNPDCFFVTEPGFMLVKHLGLEMDRDEFTYLDNIRPILAEFLHGLFNCNFSGSHMEVFLKTMNSSSWLIGGSGLDHLERPRTEESITQLCKSKSLIATKVNRINNIMLVLPKLKQDHVKVVHLVRDPRGMAPSRQQHERLPRGGTAAKSGTFRFDQRLEDDIIDYCLWLDTNYLLATNGPEWMVGKYKVFRYEDVSNRAPNVVPKIFEFIGVKMHPSVQSIIEREIKRDPDHGQKWRTAATFEEVRRVQELCPERVFQSFGYVVVESEAMLKNYNRSLVVPWEY